MPKITMVDAEHLLASYDVFFLDAFGVLIHSHGAIPHAQAFIDEIEKRGKDYLIVTNDANRLPETAVRFYEGLGIQVPLERILTAGSCLVDVFQREGLVGSRCVVYGSPDSQEYVRRAGGQLVPAEPGFDADVIVIGNDAALATVQTFNDLLSSVHRLIQAERTPRLILPNTDMIYPKGADNFGVTCGSIALLLEEALTLLHPRTSPKFLRVGKPNRPIFEIAMKKFRNGRGVMIGDQLRTDVLGANAIGLDSALVLTGLTRTRDDVSLEDGPNPTWILADLSLNM